MKLKILDNNFYSDHGSCKMFTPKYFTWDRSPGRGDLVFFTDLCLPLANLPIYKNSKKIAWILEPFPINPYPYHYIAENHHKFDLILSHNKNFVEKLGPKAEYYFNGMTLIKPDDWRPHNKTKYMSIVVSNKNMTEDHGFRHKLVKALKDKKLPVDIYGKGYNYVEDKGDALRDYKFSIALENCQINSYISDKIIDCLATYTIPIYRGCESIKDFFNMDGIWTIQSIDDCINMVERLMEDADAIYYDKAQAAMIQNFQIAERLRVAEDYIYENILVPRKLI